MPILRVWHLAPAFAAAPDHHDRRRPVYTQPFSVPDDAEGKSTALKAVPKPLSENEAALLHLIHI